MVRTALLALFVALLAACGNDPPVRIDGGNVVADAPAVDAPAIDMPMGDGQLLVDARTDGSAASDSFAPDAGAPIAGAANRRLCTSDAECDDHIACTEESCVVFDSLSRPPLARCEYRPVANLCPMGQSCDLRMGCRPGRVCAMDSDCTDPDDCTQGERCDSATRFCVYARVRDDDGDGYASTACGGGDCDDTSRDRHPGPGISLDGREVCNGVDDNCDGMTDESTPGGICGAGGSCVMGTCQCSGGRTYCDGAGCVNAQTDPAHCGGCSNRCADGAACMAGRCELPCSMVRCGTACVDTQTDAMNCGGCGRACASGQTCAGGMCRCGSGQTACPSGCVDLMSDPGNCGECGVTCTIPETSCMVGACLPSRPCPDGLMCGGRMVCPSFDPVNCGRCGNRCPLGQRCLRGVCGT